MAYLDAQLLVSDAQVLSATARSTNVIDLQLGLGGTRKIFDGEELAFLVAFDVGLAGTTPTLTINVRTATDAAMTSPVTIASLTPAQADAATGKQLKLTTSGANVLQFIELQYVLGGTTPTATVTAALTPLSMVEKVSYYKDNSTIS